MKNYEDKLNELYDKKLKVKTDALETQRDTDMGAVLEREDGIDSRYAQAQNRQAVLAERERQSFNTSAAASGINSGAASQARLAMSSEMQRNSTALESERQREHSEAEREKADIENSYKREIALALQENDYERAKAMFEEYKRSGSEAESEAKLRAGYGDFSGYSEIYGEETAAAMREIWIAKNPKLARNMGYISDAQYRKLVRK